MDSLPVTQATFDYPDTKLSRHLKATSTECAFCAHLAVLAKHCTQELLIKPDGLQRVRGYLRCKFLEHTNQPAQRCSSFPRAPTGTYIRRLVQLAGAVQALSEFF